MTTNPNDWLKNEILNGLSKLTTLGLDRQPSYEVIPGTALTWFEALTAGKAWDYQRDVARVRDAFCELAVISSQWPTPRDFMAVIHPPARPHFTAVGRDQDLSLSPAVQKIITEMAASLRMACPLSAKLKTPPTTPYTEVDP